MSTIDTRALIDDDSLRSAVARLTGQERIEVADWRAEPIGRRGNPVTDGVYRVSGAYRAGDASGAWSLVLKGLRAPVGPAWTGARETDWNFWQREALVYQFGLLHRLPPGLSAPRCLGVETRGSAGIRLWLEDLGAGGGAWSLEEYGRAAALLGRLGTVDWHAVRDAPWLSRRMLHAWCDLHSAVGAPPLPVPPGPLLRLLESVPLTLCHRDAAPGNLRLRPGDDDAGELVLFDWALCGIGPIGEDLGPLLMQAARDLPAEAECLPERIITAYLAGLRESGWRGDERLVWSGALAAALLRAGLWLARERRSWAPADPNPLQPLIGQLARDLRIRTGDPAIVALL